MSTDKRDDAPRRLSDAEIDKLIEEGRIRLSGFTPMPNKGEPITGPVQVYEDKFPRHD